ncbi:MAG: BCCT family transporter [Vampirovibrionales bacterium]
MEHTWQQTLLFLTQGYAVLPLLALGLCAWVVVHPMGRWVIGGETAQPTFSFASWLCLLFSAGMGTGMLVWGPAEPLMNTLQPITTHGLQHPLVAFHEALAAAYLHWGVHPWGLYAISSVLILWLQRQYHATGLARLKQRAWVRTFVLGLAFTLVLTLLFGMATTLVSAVVTVQQGLGRLLPASQAEASWVGLSLLLACLGIALWSATSGLSKGVRYLSELGVGCAFILWVWVAWQGQQVLHPSDWLASSLLYGKQFLAFSLGTLPYVDSQWFSLWTTKNWAWWLSWTPMMGLFGILTSYGRQLRTLVLAMVLIPSLMAWLWFSILGSVTHGVLEPQLTSLSWQQAPSVLVQLLQALHTPSWGLLAVLALCLVFAINSADSMLSCLVNASKGFVVKQPSLFSSYVYWGAGLTVISLGLWLTHSVEDLQWAILIAGVPYGVLFFGLLLALLFSRLLTK